MVIGRFILNSCRICCCTCSICNCCCCSGCSSCYRGWCCSGSNNCSSNSCSSSCSGRRSCGCCSSCCCSCRGSCRGSCSGCCCCCSVPWFCRERVPILINANSIIDIWNRCRCIILRKVGIECVIVQHDGKSTKNNSLSVASSCPDFWTEKLWIPWQSYIVTIILSIYWQ